MSKGVEGVGAGRQVAVDIVNFCLEKLEERVAFVGSERVGDVVNGSTMACKSIHPP